MKKMFCFLICLVIVISAFVSCGQSVSKPSDKTESETTNPVDEPKEITLLRDAIKGFREVLQKQEDGFYALEYNKNPELYSKDLVESLNDEDMGEVFAFEKGRNDVVNGEVFPIYLEVIGDDMFRDKSWMRPKNGKEQIRLFRAYIMEIIKKLEDHIVKSGFSL